MSRISKATVIIDGEDIASDFSKFKENDLEVATRVQLYNGEDDADGTPSYGFSLTYLPGSGADRTWLGVKNATVIIQYKGGNKVIYGICRVLKQTFNDSDGKAAKEYQLEWFAKTRKES